MFNSMQFVASSTVSCHPVYLCDVLNDFVVTFDSAGKCRYKHTPLMAWACSRKLCEVSEDISLGRQGKRKKEEGRSAKR